jgi:hypothetical protein
LRRAGRYASGSDGGGPGTRRRRTVRAHSHRRRGGVRRPGRVGRCAHTGDEDHRHVGAKAIVEPVEHVEAVQFAAQSTSTTASRGRSVSCSIRAVASSTATTSLPVRSATTTPPSASARRDQRPGRLHADPSPLPCPALGYHAPDSSTLRRCPRAKTVGRLRGYRSPEEHARPYRDRYRGQLRLQRRFRIIGGRLVCLCWRHDS